MGHGQGGVVASGVWSAIPSCPVAPNPLASSPLRSAHFTAFLPPPSTPCCPPAYPPQEMAAVKADAKTCAMRELLGLAQLNVESRPMRWRRGLWGLSGTPLLSQSVLRCTEMAAISGAYVAGAASHWRTMERASTRDVFLRHYESVPSYNYRAECAAHAQEFINAAVQRNRVSEFTGLAPALCTLPGLEH